ncbi:hypothetical protein BKA93DRAFT_354376 [Sparassis latifolia]
MQDARIYRDAMTWPTLRNTLYHARRQKGVEMVYLECVNGATWPALSSGRGGLMVVRVTVSIRQYYANLGAGLLPQFDICRTRKIYRERTDAATRPTPRSTLYHARRRKGGNAVPGRVEGARVCREFTGGQHCPVLVGGLTGAFLPSAGAPRLIPGASTARRCDVGQYYANTGARVCGRTTTYAGCKNMPALRRGRLCVAPSITLDGRRGFENGAYSSSKRLST